MASNDELRQAISLVVSENGLEPTDTKGQSNKELLSTLAALREVVAAIDADDPLDGSDADTDADTPVNGDANAGAEAATVARAKAAEKRKNAKVKRPPYYVAPGKALTSLKGILEEDVEVKAEYFAKGAAGEAVLNRWVDEEFILKG